MLCVFKLDYTQCSTNFKFHCSNIYWQYWVLYDDERSTQLPIWGHTTFPDKYQRRAGTVRTASLISVHIFNLCTVERAKRHYHIDLSYEIFFIGGKQTDWNDIVIIKIDTEKERRAIVVSSSLQCPRPLAAKSLKGQYGSPNVPSSARDFGNQFVQRNEKLVL